MTEFEMPTLMEKEARVMMEEVITKLKEMGLYEDASNAALVMLARNFSTFVQAQKTTAKEGLTIKSDRGNIAEHPCVKIARDAQTSALKIMTEFGLTAKSRSKVKAKEKKEDDPFTAFVKKKK